MNVVEVKKKAKIVGLIPGKIKKTDLIWAIQKAEGNTTCFAENDGNCPYLDCCWLDDCLVLYKKRMRNKKL